MSTGRTIPCPDTGWHIGRFPVGAVLARLEDVAACLALVAMAVLPVGELLSRNIVGTGLPGSVAYVTNLTLWTAFLGAMIATRERQHLSLATYRTSMARSWWARVIVGFFVCAVATSLAWSAARYTGAVATIPEPIAGWLPVWVVQLIMPLAFCVIALRSIEQYADGFRRLLIAAAVLVVAIIGLWGPLPPAVVLWFGLAGLALATALGGPIFILIGGVAVLLFYADGVPVAAVAVEMHRIVGSPAIPTIPLFTLAGYVLAQRGTSERLVHLFRAWFGWIPGGLAIVAALVCAFFSAFTGASGITILALGGLLLPVLVSQGYGQRFSLGLLTATGSIGLLFPPSLAVIVYAVVARIPIPDLFLAGIIPGCGLVVLVALYGVHRARVRGVKREAFAWGPAWRALVECRWELLLPVVTLVGLFGGFSTLAETAAITAVYAIIVQTLIRRELSVSELAGVLRRCVTLVGGVLIILATAMGLTNWIVDAEIPDHIAEAIQRVIDSPILFLLALNLVLLVVGCLMDIFSATVVVVPLIIPVATSFGIDPLHLALIFLVNLELGYLTPPIGMNLFLASFCFDRPVMEIGRSALPFGALYLVAVLAVTYLPLFFL